VNPTVEAELKSILNIPADANFTFSLEDFIRDIKVRIHITVSPICGSAKFAQICEFKTRE
jgi:hypothetical protein